MSGSGGEDPQSQTVLLVADDPHFELDALGPPDPVALHRLDPFGPVQGGQVGQELVGVGGDPEEPLFQVALDHQVAGPLAGTVGQDLLVGQHRLAARAPVDRGLGPVGQARLQQTQEDHLVPADVGRIVAPDLPTPVVDGAERDHALLQLGDPLLGEDPGVGPGPDGRVLRRQAERVEAEGREHGEALHGPVTDQKITERVVPDVALVGGAARVGVHAQDVLGRTRVVGIDLVGALLGPQPLPLLLDLLDIEGPGHPVDSTEPRAPTRHAIGKRPGRSRGAYGPGLTAGIGAVAPGWRRGGFRRSRSRPPR